VSDHGINPSRAALITKRLAQAFAFARDVIDAPRILEVIPDGSTLLFRDVEYHGEQVRLTAHPAQDRPGWWTARITGPAQLATESRRWEPPLGTQGMGGKWSSPPTFPEHGPTANDALDALEEKLRESDRSTAPARRASGG
jgi:hypothetical protein